MGEDNRGIGEEEGWERDHCEDHYRGMKGEQLWDGGWRWMRDGPLCNQTRTEAWENSGIRQVWIDRRGDTVG